MKLKDNFLMALQTVRSNKLRSSITIAIIAFGIMALIGIITSIQAMNDHMRESFSSMGANGFTIAYKDRNRFGNDNNSGERKTITGKKTKKSKLDKKISLREAELFKENYHYPALVSIALDGSKNEEVHYKSKKTNPNVSISGGDENYLAVNGFKLAAGRNLNKMDVASGRNVCILGNDVAAKLFGEQGKLSYLDKYVLVSGIPYRVVGVLVAKGAAGFGSKDNIVITSYNSVRKNSNLGDVSYSIGVLCNDINSMPMAIAEATGVFRRMRHLIPTDEDNFIINKSDKMAETIIGMLGSLQGAAAAIGIITLVGAAIGLMNIMLVAVSERTKEVGLVKAIGGKSGQIKQQFLFESTLISLIGAIIGILLGIIVGNLVSMMLGSGFVIPWNWIIVGILICTGVGLGAGLWPAIKASKLNPIDALRYE